MALTKIDDRGLTTPIDLLDNEKIRFGTGNDLEIYHNGNSFITTSSGYLNIDVGNENLYLDANEIRLRGDDGGETLAKFIDDGAVELYYDGVKTFNTITDGIQVRGTEGAAGYIYLYADEGDDYGDLWLHKANTDGKYHIQNKASGSWEDSIVASGDGAVELYYDNVKKFETSSSGADFSVGTGEVDIYSTGSGDQHSLRLLNSNASAGNKIGIYFGPANNIAGASIQGIAESDFTTTANRDGGLIFTTRQDGNWNERVRIDSSGKVLIGHTASLDAGGIEGSLQITGTDSDNSSLTLSKFGADDWCSFLTFSKSRNATIGNQTACTSNERLGQILWTGSDGTDAANGCAHIVARADGNFSSNNCPTKMEFGVNAGTTSAATYLTIKPNGNVEVNDGNLVVASGHGIDFSATADGTGMVNELFDNYEEGIYTPTITAETSGSWAASSYNKIAYTRIGRQVHIQGYISIDSQSSPSGDVIISLPFTVVNNLSSHADYAATVCQLRGHTGTTDLYNVIAAPQPGLASMQLNATAGDGSNVWLDHTHCGSSWNIRFGGSYICA